MVGHDVHRFSLHEVHIASYMVEELQIAGTQIIEAWLPVTVGEEAVLGTLTVTSKQEATLTALLGKALVLDIGKGLLPLTIEHLRKGVLTNVSQQVLRSDKVIAAVHIAIPFHNAGMAAAPGE